MLDFISLNAHLLERVNYELNSIFGCYKSYFCIEQLRIYNISGASVIAATGEVILDIIAETNVNLRYNMNFWFGSAILAANIKRIGLQIWFGHDAVTVRRLRTNHDFSFSWVTTTRRYAGRRL